VVFDKPLIHGTLVRRYNRFLSEIRLDNGDVVTAHCPNSGSMKGVNVPGAEVYASYHADPRRRLKYTWELIKLDGDWVGINTQIPNRIAAEAFREKLIPAFREYQDFKSEVVIDEGTRIDFVLKGEQDCLLEVKNVTLVENGVALFPDSVTSRGTKHLYHLIEHAEKGFPAAMLYVIQHHAAKSLSPADEIDPVYGNVLRDAFTAGVKLEAWKASVSPQEVRLHISIPVIL
jgi:sugar fermentation stimulation protein A